MFKELDKDNHFDGDSALDEDRTLPLRSILKESINLPAQVLGVKFSYVHDRILDQKIFSELITPANSEPETDNRSKRCHNRKQALMPYVDQRLVCVCIRLPGVVYTIEIDPGAEKVIHWEWQSV